MGIPQSERVGKEGEQKEKEERKEGKWGEGGRDDLLSTRSPFNKVHQWTSSTLTHRVSDKLFIPHSNVNTRSRKKKHLRKSPILSTNTRTKM